MPTQTVNVHEAKTHLSRLLEQVSRGNEVIIAKSGTPIAKLSAITPKSQGLPYGLLKGKIEFLPGFDDPLPDDFIKHFE